MTSIFSTYSTGENRVTASFLAVLRSLSLSRIHRILGALLEQSEFELVQFVNQPSKGGRGVPDAVILSSVRLLVETKIERNTVDGEQLRRHLERLDAANESTTSLLVLTPDDARPAQIDEIADERVAWANFAALDQAIDELLDDSYEVVSEREAFLLREFQKMLQAEKLIANAKDVVVVPARSAWPEYQKWHSYVCQPDRSFQQVSRLAFYFQGHIQPLVPRILEVYDRVDFNPGEQSGKLGELIDNLLTGSPREEGKAYKVFLLSAPDATETVKLNGPIPNNLTAESGRTTAFTQSQRYVSSEKLIIAQATSDLVEE